METLLKNSFITGNVLLLVQGTTLAAHVVFQKPDTLKVVLEKAKAGADPIEIKEFPLDTVGLKCMKALHNYYYSHDQYLLHSHIMVFPQYTRSNMMKQPAKI